MKVEYRSDTYLFFIFRNQTSGVEEDGLGKWVDVDIGERVLDTGGYSYLLGNERDPTGLGEYRPHTLNEEEESFVYDDVSRVVLEGSVVNFFFWLKGSDLSVYI